MTDANSDRGPAAIAILQAMQRATVAYASGRWSEAEALCRWILARRADDADALNLLGVIAAQTQRADEAASLLKRAAAANPTVAMAHNNYGNALKELKRLEEALESYQRALQLDPDFAGAHNNFANTLRELGRFEEALESYARALKIKPDYAEAHYNRANTLRELGRFEDALDSYELALRIKPGYAEAYNNRGNTLWALERFDAAVDSYRRALKIRPGYAEAYNNCGNVLRELRRFDEALVSFERALELKSDYADAYNNRGNTLRELQRFGDALVDFERALKIKPSSAEAYNNRGSTLLSLKRFDEALDDYERALDINPEFDWLAGTRLHVQMRLCDWRDFASRLAAVIAGVERRRKATQPFPLLALVDSLSIHRLAAESWTREQSPVSRVLPPIAKRSRHDRIRVGYFSGDYRDHAVALLTADLFETHDRSRFEVNAFSFGFDTQDGMRRRMERAFDRFIDVRTRADTEIAQMARNMELDIAVDLGGFTDSGRPKIFAARAAPLQVSYLGYLGTLGSEYMDYLIADATIIPPEHRRHYAERIIYLPSYQVNSTRVIADRCFGREELGLPANGFVFCCFNASYKILPETFGCWMRILRQVEGSVLFLVADNATVRRNLIEEAARGGVAADRLVFAERLPVPQYLARYRTADLFLDTVPYNAGTTASDALWAGLPVLTRAGESFASRVAASLLNSVGLPELVTMTQAQYEATAIELARDPARMEGIRGRLLRNRLTMPLFDLEQFTRHLEHAYTQIYERYHAGLDPCHIDDMIASPSPGV